jgi:hypothetical protein
LQGNASKLQKAHREFMAELAAHAPLLTHALADQGPAVEIAVITAAVMPNPSLTSRAQACFLSGRDDLRKLSTTRELEQLGHRVALGDLLRAERHLDRAAEPRTRTRG